MCVVLLDIQVVQSGCIGGLTPACEFGVDGASDNFAQGLQENLGGFNLMVRNNSLAIHLGIIHVDRIPCMSNTFLVHHQTMSAMQIFSHKLGS